MILCLTIICIVCSFLLSQVYNLTEPKIKADIAKKLKLHLMEVVFPGAKEYKISSRDTTFWVAYDTMNNPMGEVKFESIIPDTLWSVVDTLGAKIGIAFKVFPKGYGGPIETLVGLSSDTTITGIRTATPGEGLKETPGLGVKVNDEWFKRQFIGKKESEIKLKKDGGILDCITAATISSRAVADGVRKGVGRYKKFLQIEKEKSKAVEDSLK
jgi:electron transport complex protein RnfG